MACATPGFLRICWPRSVLNLKMAWAAFDLAAAAAYGPPDGAAFFLFFAALGILGVVEGPAESGARSSVAKCWVGGGGRSPTFLLKSDRACLLIDTAGSAAPRNLRAQVARA